MHLHYGLTEMGFGSALHHAVGHYDTQFELFACLSLSNVLSKKKKKFVKCRVLASVSITKDHCLGRNHHPFCSQGKKWLELEDPTRKIVKLFKLELTKFESIKQLKNNYTQLD